MAINMCRAARKTDEHLTRCGTNETVGPGTYVNTHNELAKMPGERAVPFNSLQEKTLNSNGNTSAITPGPGAYAAKKLKTSRDGIGVGHIPFRSKMNRMGPTAPGSTPYSTSTIEKNPGPGTYTLEIERKGTELVKRMKPVLEAADKTTPSIPIRRLLPDYKPQGTAPEDTEMTALIMRHTGEKKDMVGPGEYEPGGRRLVAQSAPETTFYASKLNRDLFEPSVKIDCTIPPRSNPGPGSYEVKDNMGKPKSEDPEVAEMTTYQFSSRSPLAHQVEVHADRVVPGPGRYESVGHIEQGAKAAKTRAASLGERGTQFGSLVARQGWSRDLAQPYTDQYHVHNVPGPGHYPAAPSSFPDDPKKKEAEKALPQAHKKKINGVHHPNLLMALQEAQGPLQAFNSTDDRPCNKPIDVVTPSPAEYLPEECRANSINADLKERAKVGRKGVFGTCADRFYGSPMAGKTGLPDPGIDHEENKGAHTEPRSMFQSATPRFNEGGGKPEVHAARTAKLFDTPAPGQYNIEKEPSYRSPFRTPRREHLSFGSGAVRYGNKDVFQAPGPMHVPSLKNPGPGEYADGEMSSRRSRPLGAAHAKATRPTSLVGCTTETVGPGSYSRLETTLLKKTFNVSTQAAAGDVVTSARGLVKGSTSSR